MERTELAASLLPSFLHAYVNTADDYDRAVDKAFKAADAFLERATKEPNQYVCTITFGSALYPSCGDCDCDSVKISEGEEQLQEVDNESDLKQGIDSSGVAR